MQCAVIPIVFSSLPESSAYELDTNIPYPRTQVAADIPLLRRTSHRIAQQIAGLPWTALGASLPIPGISFSSPPRMFESGSAHEAGVRKRFCIQAV